ncbi:MAG: tetratricopeptide repeat protein [bacterium]|nr:tetratricopeptide repeat protein [bacterium]
MINLRKKSWILALGSALVLGGGGFSFYHYYYHPSKKGEPVSPKVGDNFQDFMQKKGTEEMKKRTAFTLAAVYEKMVAQYPNNVELKKMLAKAYQDAGQDNKAQPLLDEIKQSESK